jgi:hypothetical protein
MPGYEVWEHHDEVVPNRNIEEEENNDWVGDDAMHEILIFLSCSQWDDRSFDGRGHHR